MQLLDWVIVFGSLFIVLAVGMYTQQYMRRVADFMSAGRVARRYLLAVSKDEMSSGAVMIVAAWEDSIALFKRLRIERMNPLDNGAVVNHQNLDESVLPDAESPLTPDQTNQPRKDNPLPFS